MVLSQNWTLKWCRTTVCVVGSGIHTYPSTHETLTHCWFDVGPASTTLFQHLTDSGPTYAQKIVIAEHLVSDTELLPYLFFSYHHVFRYVRENRRLEEIAFCTNPATATTQCGTVLDAGLYHSKYFGHFFLTYLYQHSEQTIFFYKICN